MESNRPFASDIADRSDSSAELLAALRGLLSAMSEWCECSTIQLLDAKAIARDAVARAERR